MYGTRILVLEHELERFLFHNHFTGNVMCIARAFVCQIIRRFYG